MKYNKNFNKSPKLHNQNKQSIGLPTKLQQLLLSDKHWSDYWTPDFEDSFKTKLSGINATL